VFTYYRWARPALARHNIFPLRRRGGRRGHVRLPSEDFDEDPDEWNGRDLEVGAYRDEEEAVGEEMGSVRETPVEEEGEGEEEEESRGRTITRPEEEPLL
jgi:hypothetical protein